MNAQSLQFEKQFRKLGIRFRLVGTVRFYEREEVKDALAYLSLLANRNDEVSFRRIVNRPSRGIGAASVEKIVEEWRAPRRRQTGTDLLAACRRAAGRLGPRARSGLADFLALPRGAVPRCVEDVPLAELARDAALPHGAVRDVPDAGTGRRTPAKTANLRGAGERHGRLRRRGRRPHAVPGKRRPGKPAGRCRMPTRAPRVTLITLHNTKGLEFDRVVITGLEEGIFPHYSSSGTTRRTSRRSAACSTSASPGPGSGSS